jgi:hypothetical protein
MGERGVETSVGLYSCRKRPGGLSVGAALGCESCAGAGSAAVVRRPISESQATKDDAADQTCSVARVWHASVV